MIDGSELKVEVGSQPGQIFRLRSCQYLSRTRLRSILPAALRGS